MKQYFLGIELGSTRIKAVLLDEAHQIVKSGDATWKSSLENGVWTYHICLLYTSDAADEL